MKSKGRGGEVISKTLREPRLRHVQGLRGISVGAVLLFHAGLISGGYFGVDVFFVISGFVITSSLLREYQRSGRISLRGFFLRRLLRLAPSLAVLVLAVSLFAIFWLPPKNSSETIATGLASLVGGSNIFIALNTGGYFDAPAQENLFLHTWSLSVEEQFYLVFPIIVLVVLRSRFPLLRVLSFLTATSLLISVLGPVLAEWTGISSAFGFYSPIARAWEFGVGAIVALVPSKTTSLAFLGTRGSDIVLFFSALGLFLSLVFLPKSDSPFVEPITALPVLATALLLYFGDQTGRDRGNFLGSGFLVKLGDRSYSLYLWHWPAAALVHDAGMVAQLIAILLSLPLALMAYRFVECRTKPGLLSTIRFSRLLLLAGIACFFPIVLLAFSVENEARIAELHPELSQPHAPSKLGCHFAIGASADFPVCSLGEPGPKNKVIYLAGDSNAAQFASGLILAADQGSSYLRIFTASGCSLLDGAVPGEIWNHQTPASCRGWRDRAFRCLEDETPGLVFLAWTSRVYIEPEVALLDLEGQSLRSSETKVNGLKGDLERTVDRIEAAGHQVVLVRPIPIWTEPFPLDYGSCRAEELIAGCVRTMPLDFVDSRDGEMVSVIYEVGESRGLEILDLSSQICPDSMCTSYRDGAYAYQDSGHISEYLSLQLSVRWKSLIDGFSSQ